MVIFDRSLGWQQQPNTFSEQFTVFSQKVHTPFKHPFTKREILEFSMPMQ
jgi:hypothetical protein